jgi:hypothetical protein
VELDKLLKALASLLVIAFAYAFAQGADEQHEHQVAMVIDQQAKPWRADRMAPTDPISAAKWTR